MKILKEKERKGKEKIYEELDKIDSTLIDMNIRLRRLKGEFDMKRDQNLITRICRNIEWSTNKTLLLKGRITAYELGNKLFMDQEYLQFYFRSRGATPRNLKYIPLIETKYSGKKFSKFMERELGAKAQIGITEKRTIIVSILIPRNKKNLIVYR